jgi:drug/metabolite transporter (DMT)-like permease
MALTVLAIGVTFVIISAYSLIYGRCTSLQEPDENAEAVPVPLPAAFPQGEYLFLAVLIGAFVAIEAASINVAYTLQIIPYVIAIKRLSIIFVVLYGTLVFSEHEIRKRLTGAALMVSGAIIILLYA